MSTVYIAWLLVLAVLFVLALRDGRHDTPRVQQRSQHLERRLALIDGMDALLLARLREFARRMSIHVSACSPAALRDWRTDQSACGTTVCRRDGYEIWIREDCVSNPWILAHEIGHVLALEYGGTSSEEEANLEAEKVLLSVLSREEREVLGTIVTDTLRSREVRAAARKQEVRGRDLDRRFGRRVI